MSDEQRLDLLRVQLNAIIDGCKAFQSAERDWDRDHAWFRKVLPAVENARSLSHNVGLDGTANDIVLGLVSMNVRDEQHRDRVAASLARVARGAIGLLPKVATKKRPRKAVKRGGETRVEIISALTEHHGYHNASVSSSDPITNKELAERVGMSPGTVSEFFRREFQGDKKRSGHHRYKDACGLGTLPFILARLNGDCIPRELWNSVDMDRLADTFFARSAA